MKVRVLTDTIPQWLALALLEHHEPELVVGQQARDDYRRNELWEHGTYSGYIHHGCRCVPCTTENRDHNRRYVASLRGVS